MSAPTPPGVHPQFQYLSRRSTLPIAKNLLSAKTFNLKVATAEDTAKVAPALNDKNIQGDIYLRFPKIHQTFVFFTIKNVATFKNALKSYKPTSSEDVADNLNKIEKAKRNGTSIDLLQTQVAFSKSGMVALGVSESTGDPRFEKGSMRRDKKILGDQAQWHQPFDDGKTHGVFLICAKGKDTCAKGKDDIIRLFGTSIEVVVLVGNVRPGSNAGKEHFGWEDSLSQPALRGITYTCPGQLEVDPGVIVMGYKGDPVYDNPGARQRPSWTKDGSMMVFRKLEQDVKGFTDYCKAWGPKWREFTTVPDEVKPPLTDAEGVEFFGALLVGRWKSGTPLAMAHFRDDPSIGKDRQKTNNFDYVQDLPTAVAAPSNRYCPFTAHTRKTAPRNLDPFLARKELEAAVIARSGIPYGTEYSEQPTAVERGLLFVSYQSSLDNGFVQQTVAFAGNAFFPQTSLVKEQQGVDSLIAYEDASNFLPGTMDNGYPSFFITSRGGEYYFVPSLSTLSSWAKDAEPSLDILFLQDATGSQQPYVDQTQSSIAGIVDSLVRSGKWSRDCLRIGVVAFRDHPPQEKTWITQTYPDPTRPTFTTDIGGVMGYLGDLKAEGGGDGPEAQCDALSLALDADWKDGATQVVVLITDAPPHGLGEAGDKIPDGCPLQNDPVQIASRMKTFGIILHVIACEPRLSKYFATAHDFYTGIARKTQGKLWGLADTSALANIIIGSVSESAGTAALSRQNEDYIRTASQRSSDVNDIAKSLFSKLSSSNVQLKTVVMDDIYEESETGRQNQQVWFNAEKIDKQTLSKIKTVREQRIKPKYRSGGATMSASVEEKPINRDQVQSIVHMCLARSAK